MVSAYYLLTILAGALVIFFHGRLAFAADLITTIVYIALTILFYTLSKKRLATDDRELNRSATEPVRTIPFRRSGRPHASKASAHDKTRVIHASTKFQPRRLDRNRAQQNSVVLNQR